MGRIDKVTYVTASPNDPAVVSGFAQAIPLVSKQLGRRCLSSIGGVPRETSQSFVTKSPIDQRIVVATTARAEEKDFVDAISLAQKVFPSWRQTSIEKRTDILRRAADLTRQRRFELATWMIYEMGKNWLEALGEIEETADLFDYYAQQMLDNDGFTHRMGAMASSDTNTSVMRPYGVWGVIAPWNFPSALLAAPIAAALVTGNTVVAKPASDTPVTAALVAEIFFEAGLPEGALSLLYAPGELAGRMLSCPDIAGTTFTGSFAIGFHQLYRNFSVQYPRPCIVEMGGKNPAIVTANADLEKAATGIYRSSVGMNGHKCSACSRVYVAREHYDELRDRLTVLFENTAIGNPLERETYVGPVATASGFADYQRHVDAAREANAIHTGGSVYKDRGFEHGFYVQPTLLTGLPENHPLVKDELFLPFVHLSPVDSLQEALFRANDTQLGLTAGIFSKDPDEIERFLDQIEAGVVYVNRASGATTGAWPGVQPFGGWKGSGSTGKNIGGHHTLPCYLREQSRTVVS